MPPEVSLPTVTPAAPPRTVLSRMITFSVGRFTRNPSASRHLPEGGARCRPVHPQPVGIAPRLQADGVVVAIDVAVLHQHVRRGVDIDAIRAGRLTADLVAGPP